jgi:hypothetical protein
MIQPPRVTLGYCRSKNLIELIVNNLVAAPCVVKFNCDLRAVASDPHGCIVSRLAAARASLAASRTFARS